MINESFLIPIPRTESPLDAPVLGWGIIGPGRIASAFAESLAAHTRQRIVAVGSRSIDTALNFAKRFAGCDAVRSYEELVRHPAVDIVYVSTPHSFHHQCVMLALEAGKHVLERTREFDTRTPAAGLCYEAVEAARRIAQGAIESPYMPLQESVTILETLDRIREQLASH